MNMKELAGVAEAVRGMSFTDGILSIDLYVAHINGFPRIQLTKEEYVSHFGNTVPEPFSDDYDQMKTTWNGSEFFCLVDK